ncbi:glycosyltransferase family 61 protein [Marimonas arenosa]|uniref:Glycosyltransferase family 61 protein n=1 Tax=Marimonas arenosa TaxID=1795305 RepID=A0AAE3WEZ8_9RHOB|nr:glycosyltransferase family 61 protein [Marimonas arenosa]MDQ2091409.1 glycosyltransferase family 61 protein [Marimonas arenosa]
MKSRPFDLSPPKPHRGWSSDLLELENAYAVPPQESDFIQPAGVLHADGRYCPRGALWRKHRPMTLRPERPLGDVPRLGGTWLWGGMLWGHFGHFLVESTNRLWPLPQLEDRLDGLLYIPKRPRREDKVFTFQSDFLHLLGCDLPVRVITDPTRVERLFVPGQGFGLGEIAAGTPAFRDTIHSRFGRDIAPDGPARLYISRSRLGPGKGGLIYEDDIEARLADHGYEIFHPQAHDLPTQVARYKAADTILASEGSALHLVGMTARADQRIGTLLRRRSHATAMIEKHITSFSGRAPVIVDALIRNWRPKNTPRKHMWQGEHDLPQLQKILETEGFIDAGGTAWQARSEAQTAQELGPRFELAKSYARHQKAGVTAA